MNFRPIYREGLISAIVCLSAYILLSSNRGLEEYVQPVADALARIVPSVLIMSDKAMNPQLAKISWAIQWIFFPIYLFTLLKCNPPWSKRVKEELIKNPYNVKFGFGRSLITIVVCVIIFCMILSDFGIIHFFSLIRGFGLEVEGDILRYPMLMRVPLTSNFGMMLYAWFFPFFLASLYWGFLTMILNPKAFIRSANS